MSFRHQFSVVCLLQSPQFSGQVSSCLGRPWPTTAATRGTAVRPSGQPKVSDHRPSRKAKVLFSVFWGQVSSDTFRLIWGALNPAQMALEGFGNSMEQWNCGLLPIQAGLTNPIEPHLDLIRFGIQVPGQELRKKNCMIEDSKFRMCTVHIVSYL